MKAAEVSHPILRFASGLAEDSPGMKPSAPVSASPNGKADNNTTNSTCRYAPSAWAAIREPEPLRTGESGRPTTINRPAHHKHKIGADSRRDDQQIRSLSMTACLDLVTVTGQILMASTAAYLVTLTWPDRRPSVRTPAAA